MDLDLDSFLEERPKGSRNEFLGLAPNKIKIR